MLCRCVRTVLVESVQLGGDLLVDLAFGEWTQHSELARRERAGLRVAGPARAAGTRKVVHDGAQRILADSDAARTLHQRGGEICAAARIVREHVREADHCGFAVGVRVVVALDRCGDRRRQAPAPDQDAADHGMVDAELEPLAPHPLLGRACSRCTCDGYPG